MLILHFNTIHLGGRNLIRLFEIVPMARLKTCKFTVFFVYLKVLIRGLIMKRLLPLLFAGTLALSITGCIVDTRYDLDKLNTEMTVMKGATFPVPNVTFQLGNLLQLDGYDYITCDENGDYLVRFDLDPLAVQVTMPSFDDGYRVPVDFQPLPYSFGSVPDFISGDGQQFEADLSDMTITLEADSEIPASFTASGTVEALSKGAVTNSCQFDNVRLYQGNHTYVFRDQAAFADEISVPGLANMLVPFPDAVQLSSVDLYADPDQDLQTLTGKTYGVDFKTRVETPVCFRENSRVTFTIPLEAELDLDEIGLKRAILNMVCENRIPLNFSLEAYALDVEGKRVDGVKVDSFDTLYGNSTTGAAIELTTNGDLRFAKVVLELTVSSDSHLAGLHINRNQDIRFTDMSLYLPDGIQVRIDTE